jgi:steroid 5-alpha reductase family enzyme
MKKENPAAFIGIGVVVLIAAGLAWAGSQGGLKLLGWPIFALSIALVFIIQWLAFIPAFILQTEKFFDLTGSLTYITVTFFALLLSGSIDFRSVLLAGMVVFWAARLGSFLVARIHKSGKDSRFDDIKPSFGRFLQVWTVQGLWISFTFAAALAAITSQVKVNPEGFALLGFLGWVIGLGIEALADHQKNVFRSDPKNKDAFIHSGLWSWSRHPNYFGEITLWVGVALVAYPVLYGWQMLTLISPVFVAFLLIKVSGIPLLEKRADEKWGAQADYQAYKAKTSVLIPLPPHKR